MKKINDPTELKKLASWFNIGDYHICLEFSSNDWANELTARAWYSTMSSLYLKLLEQGRTFSEEEKKGSAIFQGFEQSAHPRQYDFCRDFFLIHLPEEGSTPATSLYSPMGANLRHDDIVAPISFATVHMYGQKELSEKARNLAFDDEYPVTTLAHLEIDLTAPDSDLIEKFAEVIKKYRQHFNLPNTGKKASESNLSKLAEYRVLAYLDLHHWAQINGYQISANVYSWLIFDGLKGERFIADTLKPFADSVLMPGFISMLKKHTR